MSEHARAESAATMFTPELLRTIPLFEALSRPANPAVHPAQQSSPVSVAADPAGCSVQFDPVGRNKFDGTGCDVAKAWLARSGVSYANVEAAPGEPVRVIIGDRSLAMNDPVRLPPEERAGAIKSFQETLTSELTAAGYPPKADPARIDRPLVVGILTLLVLYVTMVYGPIAAMLVELFTTRIP